MQKHVELSEWDVEHGWYAIRLFEDKVSLPEIAFLMNGSQKWLARYIAQVLADPDLKAELMKRAAVRWATDFQRATIAF